MSKGNGNSAPAFVRLDNLSKSIGRQEILRGVTLEIRQGETMVLIGASGGGKSVVLKHITGLMRPDNGRVLIKGQDIAMLTKRKLATVRQSMAIKLFIIFLSWSFSFHILNEIRHLAWDMGYGFDLKISQITGIVTIFGSFILAILIYLFGRNII